jgi:hypothetical protein
MAKNEREPGAPPQAASEEQIVTAQREARRRSGPMPGTVTVACKIPNGIRLQLSVSEKMHEPVMGGGHRNVEIWKKSGPIYDVLGPAVPFGAVPKFQMEGGYRLTFGIPIEFWEKWRAQNADADFVRNGLIFAHESMDNLTDECIDNQELLSGLEPLNPKRLPKGFGNIEKFDGKSG